MASVLPVVMWNALFVPVHAHMRRGEIGGHMRSTAKRGTKMLGLEHEGVFILKQDG